MKRILLLTLLLAFGFNRAALAGTPAEEQYAGEIAESQTLGRIIYRYDRAAAAATDLLIDEVGRLSGKVLGWIVEEDGDDERVLFYKQAATGFAPAYSIAVRNGAAIDNSLVTHDEGEALTPAQATMIKARERALAEGVSGCAKDYNTVVIPDEKIGYLVYVLAATTERNAVVFGGHLRHDVDASGETIVGFRKFTNTCLVVRPPKFSDDAVVAGLLVSQVVTDYPTEIHVWLNLLHGVQLYVVTMDKRLWAVEDGKIRDAGQVGAKQAAAFDAPPALTPTMTPTSVAWPAPALAPAAHAGAEQARVLTGEE